MLELIRLDRTLCSFKKLLVDDRLRGGQRFPFHTRDQVSTEQVGYAALSSLMMYPGSSEAEHREHFCPGFTLADFPLLTTVPSTVWVQMGQ